MVKRLIATVVAFCATIAIIYAIVPRTAQAFADQDTFGGTSGGSANAQTISIANYSVHKTGVVLRFIPGFTNTGPAQININGLGLATLQRPSSLGLVAFSGGEFFAGEPTCIMFNGSVYVLSCNADMTPIGKTIEFRGSSAPRGSLIEDGSCVSQTTYAALFSVIGTAYGSCSVGLFKLPFSNGTAFVANDNQGANGAANRITSGGSGCAATAVGTLCGSQNHQLTPAELPNITTPLSVSAGANGSAISTNATLGLIQVSTGSGNIVPTVAVGQQFFSNSTLTGTGTSSNTSGSGLGNAHATLPPILTGIRAIKY